MSGIGFTVSLLIASLVFTGVELEDAKVGILAAALASSVITWTIFRAASRMPAVLKAHALLGPTDALVDLALPVDPARDRIRGSERGAITVVEYGDFQCPICGRAEAVFRDLLPQFDDVRFVWRHLPLVGVHPQARLAAEAA